MYFPRNAALNKGIKFSACLSQNQIRWISNEGFGTNDFVMAFLRPLSLTNWIFITNRFALLKWTLDSFPQVSVSLAPSITSLVITHDIPIFRQCRLSYSFSTIFYSLFFNFFNFFYSFFFYLNNFLTSKFEFEKKMTYLFIHFFRDFSFFIFFSTFVSFSFF